MSVAGDAAAPAVGRDVEAERGGQGAADGIQRMECSAALAGAYSGEDP
ncbi:hypothetical protein GCM10023074_46280 [Microbispora amethystogenes]|uniref:Uncharacterized protein n=1 Tax=Microbispora amethystogenes TaxID=1427754 RepID=A0ABQ4FES1_9ACTN|nr:hypothetical protein Mam01_34810 [Microbispora amethystogenes]